MGSPEGQYKRSVEHPKTILPIQIPVRITINTSRSQRKRYCRRCRLRGSRCFRSYTEYHKPAPWVCGFRKHPLFVLSRGLNTEAVEADTCERSPTKGVTQGVAPTSMQHVGSQMPNDKQVTAILPSIASLECRWVTSLYARCSLQNHRPPTWTRYHTTHYYYTNM